MCETVCKKEEKALFAKARAFLLLAMHVDANSKNHFTEEDIEAALKFFEDSLLIDHTSLGLLDEAKFAVDKRAAIKVDNEHKKSQAADDLKKIKLMIQSNVLRMRSLAIGARI